MAQPFFTVPGVLQTNQTFYVPPFTPQPIAIEDGVLAGLCILFGLLMVVLGYRLFKATIFLGAAFLGYVLFFAVLSNFGVTDNVVLVCASLGVALVCGVVALWILRFGLFAVGAVGGFVLGTWILTWLHSQMFESNVGHWVFILGLALVLGIITLILQKPLIIICTSFFGSFFVFYGIDVFARVGYADAFTAILSNTQRKPFDDRIYYMLAASAALFLIGLAIQFGCTGRTVQHQRVVIIRQPLTKSEAHELR